MNSVNLIGRLTSKPELRVTESGKKNCKFSIAVSGINDKTDFINCTAWEQQAENLCKYQDKGNQIAVIGSIKNDSYTNKDGNKKSITYVLANRIMYLDKKAVEETQQYTDSQVIQAAINEDENFNPNDCEILDDSDLLPF